MLFCAFQRVKGRPWRRLTLRGLRSSDPGADGEVVFKLGAAPAAGEVITARVTPIHWVYRAPSVDDREITGPSTEPLGLELWEG